MKQSKVTLKGEHPHNTKVLINGEEFALPVVRASLDIDARNPGMNTITLECGVIEVELDGVDVVSKSTVKQGTLNEYQQAALRTLSDQCFVQTINPDLLHAAMGLVTESGELLDALKRRAFYGKALDEVNLIEELGDLMWYIAVACEALGTTIDAVCAANIEKLKRRYPHRFTSEHAINRDLEGERAALAGGAAA